MNLFQRLPYAPDIVFRWMADDREYFQLCGFLLMARLLMKGMKLDEQTEDEFIDQTFTALESESLQIRKAAATALRKFGNRSRNDWKKISKQLSILCKSEKPDISTLANETKNDIESGVSFTAACDKNNMNYRMMKKLVSFNNDEIDEYFSDKEIEKK